jgi:ABC-type histidine transport system ATPase subunit
VGDELFPRVMERRKQPAGTLSGGKQQIVAIGRGLLAKPKLLMFGKPSLGLSSLLTEPHLWPGQKSQAEGANHALDGTIIKNCV